MALRDQLLQDKLFNRTDAIATAKKAVSSPKYFNQLMVCFFSGEYRVSQRAAWCVSHAVGQKPSLILPCLKKVINQLLRNDVHDAVVRNSIRILNRIEIPAEHHGEVMNVCFFLAKKSETPVAIKAFALSILFKFFFQYPDMAAELEVVAEAGIEDKPAVKNVAAKILTALHKRKAPRVNHKATKVNKHER